MLRQFQELADDNTSGATELIRRLVALCENCAFGYHFNELREGVALLERSQKSLPSLHAVLQILSTDFLPKLREAEENTEALAYLSSLRKIIDESGAAIAAHFVALSDAPRAILTLSRSATVLTALAQVREHGLLTHLYVLESRPMLEGIKTIRDCAMRGMHATLMVDAAMMEAVRRVQCIVVGADSVSADGYILNKIGTYAVALCAREAGVPLYVLCDSLKISPSLHQQVPLEDRPGAEVLSREGSDTFGIWNRYFEWMPVDHVTAFVTEQGVFPPDQLSRISIE